MATKQIDVYGLKIEVPEEQAAAFIAARDADKDEKRKTAERLGALETAASAATEAERKAKEKAELDKLTSKGEFDKALELERKKFGERDAKIATKFRDAEVRRLISTNPKLQAVEDPGARAALVDLFATQLTLSCRFDAEKDLLEVLAPGGAAALNNEGKPKQADAWVSEVLDASPLLKPKSSPGSGAGGAGAKQVPAGTVTVSGADVRGGRLSPELIKSGNYVIEG